MMISPQSYVDNLKGSSYEELICERNSLIEYIQEYERLEKAGDRSGEEWQIHPQPDVRYQMSLEYLSELCAFMQEKYNTEYVWGDKKLSDSPAQER